MRRHEVAYRPQLDISAPKSVNEAREPGLTATTQRRMPTPAMYRLVLETDPAFGILGSKVSDSILCGKRRVS